MALTLIFFFLTASTNSETNKTAVSNWKQEGNTGSESQGRYIKVMLLSSTVSLFLPLIFCFVFQSNASSYTHPPPRAEASYENPTLKTRSRIRRPSIMSSVWATEDAAARALKPLRAKTRSLLTNCALTAKRPTHLFAAHTYRKITPRQ